MKWRLKTVSVGEIRTHMILVERDPDCWLMPLVYTATVLQSEALASSLEEPDVSNRM